MRKKAHQLLKDQTGLYCCQFIAYYIYGDISKIRVVLMNGKIGVLQQIKMMQKYFKLKLKKPE
jgi:hypothetical protein